MKEYLLVFIVGGAVTTIITYFANSGWPTISRLAALFPVSTWISYLFIARVSGNKAVSKHSLFVLLGTIVAWLPYMFVIYYYSDKIGANKAIGIGIAVFVALALIFIYFTKTYNI
ncbi:MAG: hypothetical protein ABI643_02595 [Candidatus Doudnabacteria bacterium]